jgi:hypothetical protein
MEDNKYYTPELSEFNLTFEYEVLDLVDDTDGQWEQETFYLNNSHIHLVKYVDIQDDESDYLIRVKYLDQEDIENLGFTYDNNHEPIPYRENYNKGRIDHKSYAFEMETGIESHHYFLTQFNDNIVWIEHAIGCAIQGYIFKGQIKNKSELKRILNQLEILS